MPRILLTIVAGCTALMAATFLAVYAAITAFTGEDWPEM